MKSSVLSFFFLLTSRGCNAGVSENVATQSVVCVIHLDLLVAEKFGFPAQDPEPRIKGGQPAVGFLCSIKTICPGMADDKGLADVSPRQTGAVRLNLCPAISG